MNQMQMWGMMFGDGQHSWVEAAFMICLFWIVLAKPERIQSFMMFRFAYLTFAASIIAPSLITLFLVTTNMNVPGFGRGGGPPGEFVQYLSILGPALFVLSFLLAIGSVSPLRRSAG